MGNKLNYVCSSEDSLFGHTVCTAISSQAVTGRQAFYPYYILCRETTSFVQSSSYHSLTRDGMEENAMTD